MNHQAILVADRLVLAYGTREVVHQCSFEVGQGECVALVGANGAGKSTIMKSLVGIHPIKSGSIHYAGDQVSSWRPADSTAAGLVLCPEGRHLFPRMSVVDNVTLGMAHARMTRREKRQRLGELEELFPVLGQRRGQMAGTLSGGEQQMVALGRALASRPGLLILDEPTLGLAPLLVEKVFELVKIILSEGTTVLIAEQNVTSTLEVADRAYVMEAGEIVSQGDAAHVRDDPRLSAAFMGT